MWAMSNENWNQNDPNAQYGPGQNSAGQNSAGQNPPAWGSSWDAVGQNPATPGSQPNQSQPSASQPVSQPSATPGWENTGWTPTQAQNPGAWQQGAADPNQQWNQTAPVYPTPNAQPWDQNATQQWGAAAPAPKPTGGIGGFIRALFDLNFRKYVTPSIVKVLYVISIIGVAIYWIGTVIALFAASRQTSVFTGETRTNGGVMTLAVLDLLFGWIFALAAIALVRMQYEYMVALIRTSEYARDIKAKLGAPDAGDQI